MRAAAALEDGTEKSAVTPGPLAPARELVGEMLLEMNRPADALEEFEATLEEGAEPVPRPVRRRPVGLARRRSAEGAHATAETLLKICERGGPARPAGTGRGETMGGERPIGRKTY